MCKFCEHVEDKNKKLKVYMKVETYFNDNSKDRVEFKGISSEVTVLNNIEPNYCPYCGTKLKEIEPL